MKPYNDSPEEAVAASQALMQRARELLDEPTIADAIWSNRGFHAAAVRMMDVGCRFPIGKDAQSYIALVLAAAEYVKAQGLFDAALDEAGA